MSCPVSSAWGNSHASSTPTPASNEAPDPKAAKAKSGKKQSWPPKANEQGPFQEDTESTEGLSAIVVSSNIPKAGTDGTWDFPSPQRFYNALKKKGYEASAQDVPTVVSIHNTVNERCWQQIMEWEALHEECKNPKLKRFKRVYGTPEELSPKSRFMQLAGYSGLFDRHDWTVDRCGKEVRYVIDFWRGKQVLADMPSIYLDVRPALDDWGAVWDHVRMWYRSVVSPTGSARSPRGL